MNLRKRLIAGAISVGVLAAAGVAIAVPANASWDSCASGQMCAYVDSNGNGPAMRAYYNNTSWNGSWGNYDNTASSIWNNGTSSNVNVYVTENYSGSNFTVYRGTSNRHTDLYWDSTGGFGAGYWNDNLSSNYWI